MTDAKVLAEGMELVSVDRLTPHPQNPRVGDVGAIVESIKANGFYAALGVQRSTSYVLVGNHRLLAARELGMPKVPVVWLDVDDDRALRILLADNRTSDLASYDDGLLAELLQGLAQTDVGFEGSAWDGDSLDSLLADLRAHDIAVRAHERRLQGDPDEAPPVPPEPLTNPGDLWVLGSHRLVCGDAADAGVVARVLEDAQASLLVTDPPYGVDYGAKNAFLNAFDEGNRVETPIASDGTEADAEALWRAVFTAVLPSLTPGASYYVTGPGRSGLLLLLLLLALRDCGYPLRQVLAWAKNHHVLGRADYHGQWEPILYGWVPGAAHRFYGPPGETTLWQIDRPHRSEEHPTMKPVALYERAIRNSSNPGELVLDPFAGSGTLAVACENLDRRAAMVELDPGYCDVIVTRWETLTGETAQRIEAQKETIDG